MTLFASVLGGPHCAKEPAEQLSSSFAGLEPGVGENTTVSQLPSYDELSLLKHLKEVDKPVTVVAFWASWCLPCVREMPELAAYYRETSRADVDVLGLCLDELPEASETVQHVLDDVAVPFPMARMNASHAESLLQALAIPWDGTLPITLVFDGQGRVLLTLREPLSRSVLRGHLNALLRHTVEGR